MAEEHLTKTRIKQAALKLFVAQGVAETSVRDLAQAAGIAEGTLYRHYPAKEDMVRDLFREHFTAFAERLERLAGGQKTLKARLRVIVADACRMFDEDPTLYRFLLLAQHEALPRLSKSVPHPMTVLKKMVREAAASGEADVTDPDLAAALVMGLLLQPALAVVHGSLKGPLSPHAGDIVAACERVLKS